MKIVEIFEGIAGGGKYAGVPMLFIRLGGCTRSCDFCDTKHFNKYEDTSMGEVIRKIQESNLDSVCWTGGEPLIQRKEIYQVIGKTKDKYHFLETNGDLVNSEDFSKFYYLSISPKSVEIAKILLERITNLSLYKFSNWDIKIVTDLKKVGVEMIPYATMLTALSTFNKKRDLEIKRRVWKYCVKHNLGYSPRLQVEVWGRKRYQK